MDNIEAPAEELKKLKNTVVSFIRKQESDYIKPLVGKLDTAVSLLVEVARKAPGLNQSAVSGTKPFLLEKQKDTKSSTTSAAGFLLPGSASEGPESVTTDKDQTSVDSMDTNFRIAMEKKDNEIQRLKTSLRELVSRFTKRGDSYMLSISRQEKESIAENCR